jgi:hypothetical protein
MLGVWRPDHVGSVSQVFNEVTPGPENERKEVILTRELHRPYPRRKP